MTFVAFAGPFLLGAGPLVVIFCVFMARKSFVVLLSLASAFYWLTVLLLLAIILRGWTPLSHEAGSHAGAVIFSVIVEQLAKYGLFRAKQVLKQLLSEIGQRTRHGFTPLDDLWLSFGLGFGHALTHSTFFFISLLEATSTGATYYDFDRCPKMSIFLVMALSTLGLALFHAFSTIVYFEGLANKNMLQTYIPPLTHLFLGLITIINFNENGCLISIPQILAIGFLFAFWATVIVRRELKQEYPSRGHSNTN